VTEPLDNIPEDARRRTVAPFQVAALDFLTKAKQRKHSARAGTPPTGTLARTKASALGIATLTVTEPGAGAELFTGVAR